MPRYGMSRPLRIEFPGAVYHVTARGDRREAIFVEDADRHTFLRVVSDAMERFDASALAYCLMGNHYHFVLQTQRANLSQLMRHVNGVYTQQFNRRHGKVGHVFQGRFNAVLVDRDAYLLQACRYVDLNPVRARLVAEPADWPWSSCRAHLGLAAAPPWLDSRWLRDAAAGVEAAPAQEGAAAHGNYAAHLAEGRDVPLWPQALRQQIFLGDDAFIARSQACAGLAADAARAAGGDGSAADVVPAPRPLGIPSEQLRPPRTLQQWLALGPTRERALRHAHVQGGLSLTAMARELGLSVSRISRLVARAAPGVAQAE